MVWNTRLPDRWVAQREVWYDVKSLLPMYVFLFDANGRVILRARLTQHRQVELPNVPQKDWPYMPGKYNLFFPDNGSKMEFTLKDVMLQRGEGPGPSPTTAAFADPPSAPAMRSRFGETLFTYFPPADLQPARGISAWGPRGIAQTMICWPTARMSGSGSPDTRPPRQTGRIVPRTRFSISAAQAIRASFVIPTPVGVLSLAHRGTQLAVLLEGGEWVMTSEDGTNSDGPPLPGGAI